MANDNQVKKVSTHVGEYGDHPVGGAVGAAVGAVASAVAVGAAQGAAMGTLAGLPGMAAGVAIGGVVGALAGKGLAQEINPTTEDAYWSENYKSRPYVGEDQDYTYYGPAYRNGVDAFTKNEGKNFDEIEPQLSKNWESKGGTSLSWDKAKPASRDAYDRLYNRRNDEI